MPRRFTSSEAPPPAFTRAVVLPVVAAVLATTTVLAGGLFWAADASNEVSIERQTRMARQALDASVDQLAQNQEGAAVWDDTYEAVRRRGGDVQWLDDNVGAWLHDAYGHDHVYLLDARGRSLYAMVDGTRRPPEAYRAVERLVTPLVLELRGGKPPRSHKHDHMNPSRGAMLLPSGVRMPKDAVHISHLARVEGRPAAISVMAVVPNSDEHTVGPEGPGYLVSIRFLGQAFLDELARRNLLDGVHFMPSPAGMPGYESIPLRSETEGTIGYVVWKPELPGYAILAKIAPIAIGCLVLTVVILTLLIDSLRRSGLRLNTTLAELKSSEAQALHLALHDPLTGLANRARVTQEMDARLADAASARPALALLDLDRFKQVNDMLGHGAGDILLVQIAARLRALCPEEAIVARLGGDEFALFFSDAPDEEAMRTLCQELVGAVRRPVDLHGSIASVGASIGVAYADEAGLDRTELMRRADIALFRTKAEGKNGFRFFLPAMDAHIQRRAAIERELRDALISGQGLVVHYQPLVCARGGEVIGLEALVRWQHPVHGLLGPDHFVPVAEEVGLIVPLGEWVFREVCAATRRWPDLYFAINLSPLQFADERPGERLLTIAREEQVDPHRIELEITEGVLMADYPAADRTLRELRAAGFRIALDDFGTGYSSLGYLRRLTVDKIKIDRSFVRHVGEDTDSASIVAAIVSLGHSMGLRITAEGVDSAEQKRFLTLAGCDELQGFLFSPALPEAEVADFLAGRPLAARSAA